MVVACQRVQVDNSLDFMFVAVVVFLAYLLHDLATKRQQQRKENPKIHIEL